MTRSPLRYYYRINHASNNKEQRRFIHNVESIPQFYEKTVESIPQFTYLCLKYRKHGKA